MKVDGVPVEEYSLAHLRDAVAMVLQKNTLFSGSLRENLLWGNPEAPDEELLRACRIARVDEFLDRLENGLDTEMGQGGSNISGGQKQRICIARAAISRPPVLILDEGLPAPSIPARKLSSRKAWMPLWRTGRFSSSLTGFPQ